MVALAALTSCAFEAASKSWVDGGRDARESSAFQDANLLGFLGAVGAALTDSGIPQGFDISARADSVPSVAAPVAMTSECSRPAEDRPLSLGGNDL